MRALTAAERRGVLVVAGLFVIGAGWDLVRATRFERAREGSIDAAPGAAVPLAPAAPARAPLQQGLRDGPGDEAGDDGGGHGGDGILDLNAATARELETLDGIGPVLARRIVEHRRVHGPFRSVDELPAVRGIGPRLVHRLRPRLRATSPGP